MSIKWPLWTHCRLISICHLSLLHTHTHTHSYSWDVRGHALKVQWSGMFSGLMVLVLLSCLHPSLLQSHDLWHTHTHTHVSLLQILIEKALLELWKALLFQSLGCVSCIRHRQLPFISETHPQVIDLKRSTADSDV